MAEGDYPVRSQCGICDRIYEGQGKDTNPGRQIGSSTSHGRCPECAEKYERIVQQHGGGIAGRKAADKALVVPAQERHARQEKEYQARVRREENARERIEQAGRLFPRQQQAEIARERYRRLHEQRERQSREGYKRGRQ